MKTKVQNLFSILAVSGGLVAAQPAIASQSSDFAKALVGTSAVDMPAKAADLVSKSTPADRQNDAVAVVKAAVGLTPSGAPAIVAAVAHQNPAVAPAAAVAAATLQHSQLAMIAKSAVAAAPAQASKIVAALIKEFPKDYGLIAMVAGDAAPSAGQEILAVVAQYVPSLQTAIQAAVASGNYSPSSVLPTLSPTAQVVPVSTGESPSLSGPSFGTPSTPVPATIKVFAPSSLIAQPPGNYGQP